MQDARAVDGGDVELDVVDLHAVADLRRAAELAEDDAADGVVVVVGQMALEALVELLDRQAALDPVEVGPEPYDRRVLGIELVVDLADDLLEQVLEGHEAAPEPYSSTTLAMWPFRRRISVSSWPRRFVSGTRCAGYSSALRSALAAAPFCSATNSRRTCRTPSTLSNSSPKTG